MHRCILETWRWSADWGIEACIADKYEEGSWVNSLRWHGSHLCGSSEVSLTNSCGDVNLSSDYIKHVEYDDYLRDVSVSRKATLRFAN